MYLSAISDELSESISSATALANDLGIEALELRSVEGKSVLLLEDQQILKMRETLDLSGIIVSALDSPLFKCAFDGSTSKPDGGALHGAPAATIDQQWDILERALDVAAMLEVNRIRIFSFWLADQQQMPFDKIAPFLRRAVDVAGERGVTVMLENEHDCNVMTLGDAAEMTSLVPGLRILWDAGNEARAGGFRDSSGYEAVASLVEHVHVKDLDPVIQKWVPVGDGVIDWPGIMSALQNNAFAGAVSLETHCEINGDAVGASAHNSKELRNYVSFESPLLERAE